MPEIRINELKRTRGKSNKQGNALILSGMDPNFDLQTLEHFRQIKNNTRTPFFSDSFKSITRNFDKLFLILEFFLRVKSPVVICIFYIDNGYVSMRKKWVKPFHHTFEVKNKLLHDNFNDCVIKQKKS